MSRRAGRAMFVILLGIWTLAPGPGLEASGPTETVTARELFGNQGAVVRDKAASRGELLRLELRPEAPVDPLVRVPLPSKLLPATPGKYELTLRLRVEPSAAFGERFRLSVGESSREWTGIDHPDPKDPAFRLWTLPWVHRAGTKAELALSVFRPSWKEPRASALLLDWIAVEPRGRGLLLGGARASKVLYEPLEEITCEVIVRNLRASSARATLRATELSDIASSRSVAREELVLDPRSEKTVRLHWNAGSEEYGREARIELLDGSEVLDSASDVYNVADNVWKVAIACTVQGTHMTHPDSVHCGTKTEEQLRAAVRDARHTYGNYRELFAWAPDDVFGMTPTEESWISGQGCYQHQRSRLLLYSRLLSENGIRPITYAKSAASGPPAFELYRRHPDFGVLGRFQCQYDQEQVRNWKKQIPGQEKTIFYTWMSLVLDITNPPLVDRAINEILNSAEMFGWAGARYDDHYTFWGKPYDPLSTRNMERIFELGKKRNPKFVWGFNYLESHTPWVWPGPEASPVAWKTQHRDPRLAPDPTAPRWERLPEPAGEFIVACRNGAYVMDEEIRGMHEDSYTNFARRVSHEARVVRKYGGHFGTIPSNGHFASAFDAIYPDLLRLASRAHSYGTLPAELAPFATRYSRLLYGTGLEPLDNPEASLKVDASPGVWWHLFSYRDQSGPRPRLVVHLLGVPKIDRMNQNLQGEAPEVREISVDYLGSEGVARAWELSPFLRESCRELPVSGTRVKPADFALWKIVVLELGRKS